jgi:hypothetical protein
MCQPFVAVFATCTFGKALKDRAPLAPMNGFFAIIAEQTLTKALEGDSEPSLQWTFQVFLSVRCSKPRLSKPVCEGKTVWG